MNTTILHLITLSTLHSPAFLIPHRTTKHHFSLSNSQISKSFSTFLLTQSTAHYSLDISHNSFQNFLSTVINTDGAHEIREITIKTTHIPSTSDALCRHCRFINCTSKTHGGAIVLGEKCYRSTINSCLFFNCTSAANGGAIFSESPRFWGSSCCFVSCSCGKDNFGGSVASVTDGEVSLMFYSYMQSPFNYPEPVTNGVAYYKRGNQNTNNNNFTMNYGTVSSAIVTENANLSIIKNINAVEQISSCVFGFIYLPKAHENQYANIVNCSCLHGIFRIDNCQVSVSQFIFLRNYANMTTTVVHAGNSGILFHRCIFDVPEVKNGMLQVVYDLCLFNRTTRTTFKIQMMSTWGCDGISIEENLRQFAFIASIFLFVLVIIAVILTRMQNKEKTA